MTRAGRHRTEAKGEGGEEGFGGGGRELASMLSSQKLVGAQSIVVVDSFRLLSKSLSPSGKRLIGPVAHGPARPGSTYIPSARNVLHIVLGAQAGAHVAEVHLFGDYLNLRGHTA